MTDANPSTGFEARDQPTSQVPSGGVESLCANASGFSLEHPGSLIGPYTLLSLIGEGGFGWVWLAEQREPIARKVALKLLKPGMDTREVLARFEQERQALALMDHPGVARVLDAGVTPAPSAGRPYFVMEYVPGTSITSYCDRHKLSVRERLELFTQVCEAIQHAHTKGIIHRDIKPGNVLVSVFDAKPVVKVIDFGVAKAIKRLELEHSLFTELGQIVGTPEYMSPEQADPATNRTTGGTDKPAGNMGVDTRTDVYALGVMLYELLTGALPFDPHTLRSAGYAAIQRMIREVDPPRPSTRVSEMGKDAGVAAENRSARADDLAEELRRELEWIPLKAMRKEREARYQSPTELAFDIRNYLAGRPLVAGPESRVYRARKFVRRNRVLVGCGVASVVGGLAITAALAIGLREARIGRAQARAATVVATRETERANAALAKSGIKNKFLQSMFQWASPGFAGVDDPTIREYMDNVVASLDRGELGGDPSGESAVRGELAEAFAALGRIEDAKKQYVVAEELELKLPTPDETHLAKLRLGRGRLLLEGRRLVEAQTLLAQARAYLSNEVEQNALRVQADLSLARLSELRGDSAQAERECVRLVAALASTKGLERSMLADAQSQYGALLLRRGRYAEAIALQRDALRERTTVYATPFKPSQGGQVVGGVKDEADKAPDPRIIASMVQLGGALLESGNAAEAEPILRKSVDLWRRRIPGPSAPLAEAQGWLFRLEREAGRLDEAERLAKDTLRIVQRVHGKRSIANASALDDVAAILRDREKFEEAAGLYQQQLELREQLSGPGSVDVTIPLIGLAEALIGAGTPELALPHARRAVELRRRLLPKDHWMIASALSAHGAALHATGQSVEGLRLLLEAASIVEKDSGGSTRRVRQIYERVRAVLVAQGDAEQAANWTRKLAALPSVTR